MTDGPAPTKLLIFARYPEAGAVKTRLIPALGSDGAARLHARLTARTLAVAATFATAAGTAVELWYTGVAAAKMRRWLASAGAARLRLRRQPAGDLGARLQAAFAAAFAGGARAVLAIGTDCPGLESSDLVAARAALAEVDLVLGPATDGGYYLIGLRKPVPALFAGVTWGSAAVLAETRERAATSGLSCRLLAERADVDRVEDLAHVTDLLRVDGGDS